MTGYGDILRIRQSHFPHADARLNLRKIMFFADGEKSLQQNGLQFFAGEFGANRSADE